MARGQTGALADEILYGDFGVVARGRMIDAVTRLLAEDEPYHANLGLLSDYSGGENWMLRSEILEKVAPEDVREGVIPGSKAFEEIICLLDPVAYRGEYHLDVSGMSMLNNIQIDTGNGKHVSPMRSVETQAIEELTLEQGEWRTLNLRDSDFCTQEFALIYIQGDDPGHPQQPLLAGMVLC